MRDLLAPKKRYHREGTLLIFLIGFFCPVFSAELPDSVNDFTQNQDYCHYMVAPPSGAADEFEREYSSALLKTVDDAQRRTPGMTTYEAILLVRNACETRRNEVAGVSKP